jgi:hypothetical protein
MDRLKLETAYRRALDVLMSAVDERQLQAAIFRLDRAQARLHGWGMPGSHDPERRGHLGARAGRPSPALRHLPQATGLQGRWGSQSPPTIGRSSGASASQSKSFSRWGNIDPQGDAHDLCASARRRP